MVPNRIIDYYNLRDKIVDGYIYARIDMAWYGLKQAGRIAHEDLVEQLAKHGYRKAPYTQGLFLHDTEISHSP